MALRQTIFKLSHHDPFGAGHISRIPTGAQKSDTQYWVEKVDLCLLTI
jgi:hypothetical protein